MTNKEAMQMAQEAGNMRINDYYTDGTVTAFSDDQLKRFAALVASAEREACAKLCEKNMFFATGEQHAEAIRARGQA